MAVLHRWGRGCQARPIAGMGRRAPWGREGAGCSVFTSADTCAGPSCSAPSTHPHHEDVVTAGIEPRARPLMLSVPSGIRAFV